MITNVMSGKHKKWTIVFRSRDGNPLGDRWFNGLNLAEFHSNPHVVYEASFAENPSGAFLFSKKYVAYHYKNIVDNREELGLYPPEVVSSDKIPSRFP
jgi:hypothetical protein